MTFGEWTKEALAHLWDLPGPSDDPTRAWRQESILLESIDRSKISHVESRIILTINGRFAQEV
jgi:hypothetical protein